MMPTTRRASASVIRCAAGLCTASSASSARKRKQPHPRASQRGNKLAPSFEVGKKVFAQADQQLVIARPQVESLSHRLVVVDSRGQIGGNAVLGQVTEVIPECVDQIGNPLTEREELFELVEDDHRREWIVPRTP